MRQKIYEVYDDGQFLMAGTKDEISTRIGSIPDRIPRYTQKKYRGKYTFKATELRRDSDGNNVSVERQIRGKRKLYCDTIVAKPHKKVWHIKKPNYNPPTKQERLQYVHEELLRSGITCLGDKEKAEEFVSYLKSKGIKVNVREGRERDDYGKVKRYPILEIAKC